MRIHIFNQGNRKFYVENTEHERLGFYTKEDKKIKFLKFEDVLKIVKEKMLILLKQLS